jgi:hypothetical protein
MNSFCEVVASMERTLEELEDLLPESSTQLVSLNTRIPRNVSRMIDESVGMLQTESLYLKVSKQVAVQILIERGFQAIREQFERQDQIEEQTSENVVSMEQPTKAKREWDINAYHQMANKTFYEPRNMQSSSKKPESMGRIQSKLGL